MQGAIADYTAVIELEGAPKEKVAKALVGRSGGKEQLGEAQSAIADCTAVIEMEGASKEQRAWALVSRGSAKRQLGDPQGAIADYKTVIRLEGASKEVVATALVNRGIDKGQLGDAQGATADYTAVIEMEGAPKEASRQRFIQPRDLATCDRPDSGLSAICWGYQFWSHEEISCPMRPQSRFLEGGLAISRPGLKMCCGRSQRLLPLYRTGRPARWRCVSSMLWLCLR